MNNINIKYILIGDLINKTIIFDSSKILTDLFNLRREAMFLFEKFSTDFSKENDWNTMQGQLGVFNYLYKENIFYLLCVNTNYPEKKAFGLIEEIINEDLGVQIKKGVEVLQKQEYENVINKLNLIVNKYETEDLEKVNKGNIQSEQSPILLDEDYKKDKIVITQENKNKHSKIDVRNVVIIEKTNSQQQIIPQDDKKGENENIKKELKSRNIKLCIILTFLTIGIILAIILPIVLQ